MSAKKAIKINLNIGDQLTTLSCGHIVIEITKFIAYQRLQIPYTYQWLKQVVNKRQSSEDNDKREGHQSERHFYVASTALKNLDFILKSLMKEIDSVSRPEEICIMLGATPITCKEIYRIILPTVCHKQQCHSTHIATDQKIQMSVFKALVTSEKLNAVFFNALPPTNMYIFIKKKMAINQDVICTDTFVTVTGYKIPRSSKVVTLDFRTHRTENLACCNEFEIFGEAISKKLDKLTIEEDDNDFSEIECTDDIQWFQSCYIMKGFKDCIVNGSSVTNAWLHID